MFKKSMVVISIIILSCIYTVSCKSRSSHNGGSSLASFSVGVPDDMSYVTRVRVVAVSESEKCTGDITKQIVTFGQSINTTNKEQIEKSFDKEDNFVDKTDDDSAAKISLFTDCRPYNVTLGYWCDPDQLNEEQKKKAKNLEAGLCYIGTENTDNGTLEKNNLQLTISLKAQNGWDVLKKKVEVTTEENEVKLADVLNESSCLYKSDNKFTFLDQQYNAPQQNKGDDNKRIFYFFKKDDCYKFLTENYQCSKEENTRQKNVHFVGLQDNSTQIPVIASINIDSQKDDTKFYDKSTLDTFLDQKVSTKFVIKILDLPGTPSTQEHGYLRLTTITCTKK